MHWLSILNSLLVLLLLSGVVAIVMFRTIRRDLAKYEEYLVNDPEAEKLTAPHHADSDLSGWKVLKGDVFRAPVNPKLLSTVASRPPPPPLGCMSVEWYRTIVSACCCDYSPQYPKACRCCRPLRSAMFLP